jgi:hypothetical protein
VNTGNVYAYCDGDPVNCIDTTGLGWISTEDGIAWVGTSKGGDAQPGLSRVPLRSRWFERKSIRYVEAAALRRGSANEIDPFIAGL